MPESLNCGTQAPSQRPGSRDGCAFKLQPRCGHPAGVGVTGPAQHVAIAALADRDAVSTMEYRCLNFKDCWWMKRGLNSGPGPRPAWPTRSQSQMMKMLRSTQAPDDPIASDC